jgi:Integrase core domain
VTREAGEGNVSEEPSGKQQIWALDASEAVELASRQPLEAPGTEQYVGALPAETVRCTLPVGREIKMEIPVNGTLRDELLNVELFYTLHAAQVFVERWRCHYNTHRPHSALGYRPPASETRTVTRSVCQSYGDPLRPQSYRMNRMRYSSGSNQIHGRLTPQTIVPLTSWYSLSFLSSHPKVHEMHRVRVTPDIVTSYGHSSTGNT